MSSEAITILVVPRDRFSVFPRCLEALYKFTQMPFRLVVVAGGTDGGTERYLMQLQAQKSNLKVVLVKPLLLQGEARNIAMSHAEERYCVVLENDTIVRENWLPPLLECMREERAAAVMPLIFWHRGIHAAGCVFEERRKGDVVTLHHKILYTEIRRRQIDYPENHCILLDRKQLPDTHLFDDVEPFDVDLGLTLRKRKLIAFLEPRSVVTYTAPPRWEVCDVPLFRFRWDPALWEERNRLFMQKWGVQYDAEHKRASYRRQQLRIGPALWFPNRCTIELSNAGVFIERAVVSLATRVSRCWVER